MTTTHTIHDLAREFDRLFPADVDATEIDWGHGTMSGHRGYDNGDEPHGIGWFCEGGNVGHPVLAIHADDVPRAGDVLAELEAVESLTDVEEALSNAGVRWERC